MQGTSILTIIPPCGHGLKRRLPPERFTMASTMESPRPLPWPDPLRQKRCAARSLSDLLMPGPLSRTEKLKESVEAIKRNITNKTNREKHKTKTKKKRIAV